MSGQDGASKMGPTPIVIFEGTMDTTLFIKILQTGLLPFISLRYPSSHRLMQDNNPKHTSKRADAFYDVEGINWWKTPPIFGSGVYVTPLASAVGMGELGTKGGGRLECTTQL